MVSDDLRSLAGKDAVGAESPMQYKKSACMHVVLQNVEKRSRHPPPPRFPTSYQREASDFGNISPRRSPFVPLDSTGQCCHCDAGGLRNTKRCVVILLLEYQVDDARTTVRRRFRC